MMDDDDVAVAQLVELAKLVSKRPDLNISNVSEMLGCNRRTLSKYLRCIGAFASSPSGTPSSVVVPDERAIAELGDAARSEISSMRVKLRHSISRFIENQESKEQDKISIILKVCGSCAS